MYSKESAESHGEAEAEGGRLRTPHRTRWHGKLEAGTADQPGLMAMLKAQSGRTP